MVILAVAAGVTAVVTAAVTALLVNIFEKKAEARNPFFRVVELGDADRGALLFVLPPRPGAADEDLEVIDRGNGDAADGVVPGDPPFAQAPDKAFKPLGDAGDAAELRHGGAAAEAARGAGERLQVGRACVRARGQAVELIDVLGRLQREEVEQPAGIVARACGKRDAEGVGMTVSYWDSLDAIAKLVNSRFGLE